MTRRAVCYYVDASANNPNFPPDPIENPRRWQVTDFELLLSRQQPTQWPVAVGRPVNVTDTFGSPGAGLDPGSIPPVPPGFTGELRCVQVDDSGTPIPANSLEGVATILAASGAAETYNGVTIQGLNPLADAQLDLNNIEYSACPSGFFMNFAAEGSSDPVLGDLVGGASTVASTLTLVPCGADFDASRGSTAGLSFEITNEFEQRFSATTSVACWEDLSLAFSGSFGSALFQSGYGTARVTATTPGEGVVGVLTTARTSVVAGVTASSTNNLHFLGNRSGTNRPGAVIVLRNL
jgi:hypothetical protein